MSLSAATLLSADVALPQRDALLDTAVVADCIGRRIGAGRRIVIEQCDRLRVNYQIGKSLRVLHRVDAGEACWTISARAYREGRGERAYEEVCNTPADGGWVRPVFFDAQLNTIFWVFPNDRKIAGLAAVASGRLSHKDGLPCVWHSTQLVAYAPEKSATLACLDATGRIVAYAKLASQDQAAHELRYRALCESLDANPWLGLPRTLAYLPQYDLLVIEAIAGRRLQDPATGADAVADAERLGAALAALHALRPIEAPAFSRFDDGRLVDGSKLVGRIRPDVARAIDALVNELMLRRPGPCEPPVCLHGDVHPKNAIVTDDRVALIDIEDFAIGPAAADVGSFLAALLYLRRGTRISRVTHEAIERAFLDGYRSLRPLPSRESLHWHTAAALLVERIFRAVTRMRPLGLVHMPDLLSDARALLLHDRR